MIPEDIRNEISRMLDTSPMPYYSGSGFVVDRKTQIGEFWEIPPMTEEEKPPAIRFRELMTRASKLYQDNPDDPRILEIRDQISQLLAGQKPTSKYGLAIYDMNTLLEQDVYKGIRKQWFEINNRFKGRGIFFYQGLDRPGSEGEEGNEILVAIPGDDQYDLLRLQETQGNNHYISTEKIIKQLEEINKAYCLSVVFATYDSVNFLLEKPVEKESLPKVRARLKRMCPEAENLTDNLRLGRVNLWWD
jgi:hypothetical protein